MIMRVLTLLLITAALGTGCTTVLGTSDFYVVSGGGGSGAGSEGGSGGAGGNGCDGLLRVDLTCDELAECEINGAPAELSGCYASGVELKADCSSGDPVFEGCTPQNGQDACVITGTGTVTVIVSCVDDG